MILMNSYILLYIKIDIYLFNSIFHECYKISEQKVDLKLKALSTYRKYR